MYPECLESAAWVTLRERGRGVKRERERGWEESEKGSPIGSCTLLQWLIDLSKKKSSSTWKRASSDFGLVFWFFWPLAIDYLTNGGRGRGREPWGVRLLDWNWKNAMVDKPNEPYRTPSQFFQQCDSAVADFCLSCLPPPPPPWGGACPSVTLQLPNGQMAKWPNDQMAKWPLPPMGTGKLEMCQSSLDSESSSMLER